MFDENLDKDLIEMEDTEPTAEALEGLERLNEIVELEPEDLEEISGGRSSRHHDYDYVKCTSTSVHIRAKASASSSIIGYMMHGDKLPYLGSTKNGSTTWYKVRSRKGTGYVTAKYTTRV